jgi:hypothetical protein
MNGNTAKILALMREKMQNNGRFLSSFGAGAPEGSKWHGKLCAVYSLHGEGRRQIAKKAHTQGRVCAVMIGLRLFGGEVAV